MIHQLIGNVGHLLVIVAFVTSGLATYAFWRSYHTQEKSWNLISKYSFYFHAVAIIGVCITLFLIISNHYFEYHYAFNYTSKVLPIYYQISSFWNGQEGSFLLWMFWNAILGIILIQTNKTWKAPMMMVFSFTQLFLVSMILGVVVLDIKIGSSPFLLLRDVVNDQIFNLNPDFIPEDGRGLNPLLQNYWMVIHPPTLFLGFATTVIPFAYCMAGLYTGRFKEWIRPALPWAQFSAAVLGVGILMGAYWAYETLSFGGYWSWDPVENAIYVPWLIMVAGIHTMIAFNKNETALKVSIILIVASYVLIVYSTFLTRSGILGNASVHSFTDLGLSGQLLIYLFVFLILSIILIIKGFRRIPSSKEEVSTYSREFWIFMGAITLCLMGFQVIIPTSIPVWNAIVEFFGGTSNVAPPAEPIGFYTKFQLYFAIAIAVLSGTGQFFWWKKMDKTELKKQLYAPFIISLIASALIIVVFKVHDIWYILLLTASLYSISANVKIFLSVAKSNIKLSGGAISHIGVAMMLIGILFSSGYSKIISTNYTSRVWNSDFPDEMNQKNLLLWLNQPRQMEDYSLSYKGIRKLTKSNGYIDLNDIAGAISPLELIIRKNTVTSDGTKFETGDTIKIVNIENSYFEVLYKKENGSEFTLFPRIQINEQMGMLTSPDIHHTLTADLYTHISNLPDPDQEVEWGELQELKVEPGKPFFINDYVARFIKMEPIAELPEIDLEEGDMAIKAIIEIEGESETYTAEPIYIIKDNQAGRIPYIVHDLAAKISIQSILPEENSFVFGLNTAQKDWIIIEAAEKPGINILWIGTLVLVIGFSVAISRRYTEFVKMRDKGME
ncbi:MAG: cytochrome c biogenesis protein CcsA [Cyclobacteriaceae bacterium]